MIEVIDAAGARRALVVARLACPSCGGTPRPWGNTRDRALATPHDTTRPQRRCAWTGLNAARVRPRTCCPAELLPGRCYPLRVIGVALTDAGQGGGSRPAANRLGVPASTVRSWLRLAPRERRSVCLGHAQAAEFGGRDLGGPVSRGLDVIGARRYPDLS
jgi:hypothetical protein